MPDRLIKYYLSKKMKKNNKYKGVEEMKEQVSVDFNILEEAILDREGKLTFMASGELEKLRAELERLKRLDGNVKREIAEMEKLKEKTEDFGVNSHLLVEAIQSKIDFLKSLNK